MVVFYVDKYNGETFYEKDFWSHKKYFLNWHTEKEWEEYVNRFERIENLEF